MPSRNTPRIHDLQKGSTKAPLLRSEKLVTDAFLPARTLRYRQRHMDERVYDLRPESLLSRFMSALLGDSGVGHIKRVSQVARIQHSLLGMRFFDLDRFWGGIFGVQRTTSEELPFTPTEVGDSEEWLEQEVRDGSYRNRLQEFARGVNLGCTMAGLETMAEALFDTDVEIREGWRDVDDLAHTSIASDTFDRADGALGTADSGQAWVDRTAGDTLTISGNKVTSDGSSVAISTIDMGVTDVIARCTASASGTDAAGIALRVVDEDNYVTIYVWPSDGSVGISKWIGGTQTIVKSVNIGATVATDYRLTARVARDAIDVWADSDISGPPTLSYAFTRSDNDVLRGATDHGVRSFGSGIVDDFTCWPLYNHHALTMRVRKTLTEEERYRARLVLNRFLPVESVLTITEVGVSAFDAVAAQGTVADSEWWQVVPTVTSSTEPSRYTRVPGPGVEQPYPAFSTYRGEAWSYLQDVDGVTALVETPSGGLDESTSAEQVVVDAEGRTTVFQGRSALMPLADILRGRASSDGVLTSTPFVETEPSEFYGGEIL